MNVGEIEDDKLYEKQYRDISATCFPCNICGISFSRSRICKSVTSDDEKLLFRNVGLEYLCPCSLCSICPNCGVWNANENAIDRRRQRPLVLNNIMLVLDDLKQKLNNNYFKDKGTKNSFDEFWSIKIKSHKETIKSIRLRRSYKDLYNLIIGGCH